MATGRHPFDAPTAIATFEALVTQAPTPPSILNPEVPRSLEELILAMLEKLADQRPSAQQVTEVLESLKGGVHPAPKSTHAPRAVSRELVGRDLEREQL